MERDRFVNALDRLIGDAVAEAAASERAKTRVLRQVAEEEATFGGVALELAERGDPVVARTLTGRMHRGAIIAVGRDFIVVRDAFRAVALLPLAAVTSLRPQPAVPPADASGARAAPLDLTVALVLSRLAGERPRVAVMALGDEQPLGGELRAVGVDVLTIKLEGESGFLAHFRIAGLAEVLLTA